MNNKSINRCRYIHGKKVLETGEGEFLILPKSKDIKRIYNYLEQRDFPFFLPMINNSDDNYEVYPYIVDSMNLSDKAIDLVHVLSLLHVKTTSYQEVSLDKVKELYENILLEINTLLDYYQQLQDDIENHIYMAPDEYLLICNISFLYENLNFSRYYLEQWYQLKKEASKERVVFLHKQPCMEYFIDVKPICFTNWELSEKGYAIFDFLYFFKKHFDELEMESLFQIYQSKFQYTEDERYLFFCLLFLDTKISLVSNHYQSTILVKKHIVYAQKVRNFVLKQDQKNQETNDDKFN